MRILLTNDDGVYAPGLEVLYHHFKNLGKVEVIAPTEEKSATGHSLTIHKPLRMTQLPNGFYSVNGSPADCVSLGLKEVFKTKPDLVISGINRGANLGQDIYLSGTVSAAREAATKGIPAFAVSLFVDFAHPPAEQRLHFKTAAKVTGNIFKKLKGRRAFGMRKHSLLNINVPDVSYTQIKGIRMAQQGFRYYSGTVWKRRDHRGRNYFWIGGQYKGFRKRCGI